MNIYTGNGQVHSIETENAMSGVLIAVRTKWTEGKIVKSVNLDTVKLDIALTTSATSKTIFPRRPILETCDISEFQDDAKFIVEMENGETWTYLKLSWSGEGDKMVHMKPNARYQINIAGNDTAKIKVQALRDESLTSYMRTLSVISVEASQSREQYTTVDNGQVIAITCPIYFNPGHMDFEIKVRHTNGKEVVYGMDELIYNSLSNDATSSVEMEDNGLITEQYKNSRLSIPLITGDYPVDSIVMVNNKNEKMEFVLTTLTKI